MRSVIGLLLVVALASGCSAVPGTDANKIAKGEERVRYSLADGDSAKFRNTVAVGDFICGEVNAKNAFGAYAGFNPFSVNAKGETMLMSVRNGSIGADNGVMLFPSACRDALPVAKARYVEATRALTPSPHLLTDSLDEQADTIDRNEAGR